MAKQEKSEQADLKRSFGGAQPGAGRPAKDGVRINRLLARDVHGLLEPLQIALGVKTDTAVIEEALRRLAQQEGVISDSLPTPRD